MLPNTIHRKSPTCLRKSTSGDIFCTPTEVHFQTQHLQKSPSFTHLFLRKSLPITKVIFIYGSHQLWKSPPTEVTNYESHHLRKSPLQKLVLITEVNFGYWCLTDVDFRSCRFHAIHSGLRKSTSETYLCLRKSTFVILWLTEIGIKSLAEVNFRFVVYISGIDTHRSILQSTKWCLYL